MVLLRNLLAALTIGLVLVAPTVVAADPSPSSYWLSLINTTHYQPTGMTVVVVPAAFFSYGAMVVNRTWIGPDALAKEPGVLAALEAISYWDWMLRQYHNAHPQLARVTWTTKVLGVDATPADLAAADIVVNTAMAADPAPFLFHLGLGLPTASEWLVDDDAGQRVCTVWNTGLGQLRGDVGAIRLRNLVVHEFGHCIGAGHTGTSLGLDHCNANGTCYDSHPDDVMSQVGGATRQCLSNLNVQSVAEGYAWATSATSGWQPHDGETYMAKNQYATKCMPSAMNRI